MSGLLSKLKRVPITFLVDRCLFLYRKFFPTYLDNMKLWVLSNYRSGSIFLCTFLQRLGGYSEPVFYEKFNPLIEERLQVYYPGRTYRKWKECDTNRRRELFFEHVINKGLLPTKMKIMRDQFIKTCGLRDEDKPLIESQIPGLKYIYLKRSDLCAVTISYYLAKKTGKWVLREGEREQYINAQVEFNEDEVLDIYRHMRYFIEENDWGKYLMGSKYLFVDFQDLVKDPLTTFAKVLNYLEFDPHTVDIERLVNVYEFVPTKKPETDEFVRRLRNLVSSMSGGS